MSVVTSIPSLQERHSLPSGEQLEPEQRKTSPVTLVLVPGSVSVELSACDLDVQTDAL